MNAPWKEARRLGRTVRRLLSNPQEEDDWDKVLVVKKELDDFM